MWRTRVTAISEANFIGILAWAVALGIAFRIASDTTKIFLTDAADAVNKVIRLVINFAPVGIFGLVAVTFAGCRFENTDPAMHTY